MIKRIAPDVDVIDVTHGIPPHDVVRGALVLADALPYMPAGVHVAVVDPGVGSERRGLVLVGGERVFVGPDNGLLVPAAEALGGIDEALEIADSDYLLHPVSRTFHGRDVFSPVAAHLALGVAPRELGGPVPVGELERIVLPRAEVADGEVRATVVATDRFGNVQLALTAAGLGPSGLAAAVPVWVDVDGRRARALVGRTFSDVPAGELVLYEDAAGRMALAVNGASAAASLAVRPGAELALVTRR